jgi:hypothetical protein
MSTDNTAYDHHKGVTYSDTQQGFTLNTFSKEENMFEIIMLFAFLYAATCQLFPERAVTTRLPSKRKSRPGKKRNNSMAPSMPRKPAKAKSRSHHYAHAA